MPICIEQLMQRLEYQPNKEYPFYIEKLGNLEETLKVKGIDIKIVSLDKGHNLIIGGEQNISEEQSVYSKIRNFVKGVFKGGIKNA